MIFNIKIQKSINQKQEQFLKIGGKGYKFLSYGKDSYASGDVHIAVGIDHSPDDKLLYIQIGKYTSIARNVTLNIDYGHDYNSVYQGKISEFQTASTDNRIRAGQVFQRIERKGEVIIGNDCWIGIDVQIMGGIIIHDGAVIAAGSVVTKDVPPYAIVGGNPAQIIRYRFNTEICKKLQKIAWWNWNSEELLAAKEDMQGEVEVFVEKYTSKGNTIEENNVEKRIPKFLFFIDFKEEEPIYQNVIKEFVQSFHHKEAELVLCYNACDYEECSFIEKLIQSLDKYSHLDIVISIYGTDNNDEDMIKNVDYLITNRSYDTVNRITLADIYNVTCLTGIRKPIFSSRVRENILSKRMF